METIQLNPNLEKIKALQQQIRNEIIKNLDKLYKSLNIEPTEDWGLADFFAPVGYYQIKNAIDQAREPLLQNDLYQKYFQDLTNNQAAELVNVVLYYKDQEEELINVKKRVNNQGVLDKYIKYYEDAFENALAKLQKLNETYNKDFISLAKKFPTSDLFRLNNKEELRQQLDPDFLRFINALMCFRNDKNYSIFYNSFYYMHGFFLHDLMDHYASGQTTSPVSDSFTISANNLINNGSLEEYIESEIRKLFLPNREAYNREYMATLPLELQKKLSKMTSPYSLIDNGREYRKLDKESIQWITDLFGVEKIEDVDFHNQNALDKYFKLTTAEYHSAVPEQVRSNIAGMSFNDIQGAWWSHVRPFTPEERTAIREMIMDQRYITVFRYMLKEIYRPLINLKLQIASRNFDQKIDYVTLIKAMESNIKIQVTRLNQLFRTKKDLFSNHKDISQYLNQNYGQKNLVSSDDEDYAEEVLIRNIESFGYLEQLYGNPDFQTEMRQRYPKYADIIK